MLFDDAELLHIPEEINFECTGCGNCCLEWPVPSTAEDRTRIIDLSREFERESESSTAAAAGSQVAWQLPKGQLFKRVHMDVLKNKTNQFQYTMEKRADGRCVFLTENNRCALHERFGAASKPGMCQLFPYTFTEAPDGYYAGVSFASSGALFNQGKSLREQREHLLDRLALFKKLFPNLKLDWTQIQLFDGEPMRWSQYLMIERDVLLHLKRFVDHTQEPVDERAEKSAATALWSERLLSISHLLVGKIPADADLERREIVPSSANVDLLLVRHLLDLYFPQKIFVAEEDAVSIRTVIKEMLDAPDIVSLKIGEQEVSLADICAVNLPELDAQSENLLARYLYARVYSKLYFGPGMAHFSLISGFHHLGLLIVLIRIKLKIWLWQSRQYSASSQPAGVDFYQLAELVRNLERKLASFQHDNESATVLQVLLESPARFERLISLAG